MISCLVVTSCKILIIARKKESGLHRYRLGYPKMLILQISIINNMLTFFHFPLSASVQYMRIQCWDKNCRNRRILRALKKFRPLFLNFFSQHCHQRLNPSSVRPFFLMDWKKQVAGHNC